MSAMIRVEIVYALPQRQELVEVRLPEGATARQAIEASGLLEKYPDIELDRRNKLGIYAKLVKADTEVRDRDRVEIYRELRVDPKVARRERFVGQGSRGAGLFAQRRPGSKAGY